MSEERFDDPEGWVDRHGDCLYRYAMARLKSPDQAADVVQETFAEAFAHRASFSGRSSERTWLVGILKHKVADHFRKERRSRDLVEAATPRQEFDHRGRWKVGPSSWAGEPSRQVESDEFRDVLAGCLDRMPKLLAETFLLRELDGLSAEEVRLRLGITPANLWARLCRSRMLLRQCLEENWFGDRSSTPPPPSSQDSKGFPCP